MLRFDLGGASARPQHILCLGAHCDDIEIGCGATLAHLLEANPEARVTWLVLGSNQQRAQEATESAHAVLGRAKHKDIIVKSFRDGYFPYQGASIKECFEDLKRDLSPDLIFTHYRHDLHQDHRLVSETTWNTFRDHMILEYEIPKYDGDLGSPNVFMWLDRDACREKIANILRSFRSQADKRWFHEETFLALLRLRGLESNAPDGYAEAFYARKVVFQ